MMDQFTRGAILPATHDSVLLAADVLCCGGLIGLPTETVYGLAADATNGVAVAAIFEVKGRPAFNPLISHVPDVAEARRHGVLDDAAERLAAAFWPGPLTLVVPHRAGSPISDLARAGLDSVALRAPCHSVAQAIIRSAGRPLAAPSANRSGRISPTTAGDVAAELSDRFEVVIDGGPCDVGLESSVVACLPDGVRLLRPGGVSRTDIERVVGRPLAEADAAESPRRSPGMLLSHYAPIAPLHVNVTRPPENHAVLTFGSKNFMNAYVNEHIIDLSPDGDLRQAAARLFSSLRALDATRPEGISVTPIPAEGLGEAINDRLARAAAPRQVS
jgi:L-threonylcarbamoyladenylate synthase